MESPPVLLVVNYHRIADPDPTDSARRLHTIGPGTFAAQVSTMSKLGPIISLDDAREGLTEPLSFAITFDDVRASSRAGMGILRDHEAPYGVFPSARLTREGYGVRDKVYLLLAARSNAHLVTEARRRLGPVVTNEDLDFYQLTRSLPIPPAELEAELIDPLVAEVLEDGTHQIRRRHLDWADLRRLAEDPLATIGSHGDGHLNLELLAGPELQQDVSRAHAEIAARLGAPPRWFAVPFGRVSQPLALDLTEILLDLGYHGCLWVGPEGNLISAPRRTQLAHIIRLHAPDSVPELERAVATAQERAVVSIAQSLTPRNHRRPVTFASSDGLDPLVPIEHLVRAGKDYATDPAFYRYQFIDNPSKGRRADHETVRDSEGRLEAIGYSFHTTFTVGGASVVGALLSGWRRLPHSHAFASARIVRRIVDRSPIVGVYDPSPLAAPAFTRWRAVDVHRHDVPLPRSAPPTGGVDAVHSEVFDDEMAEAFGSVPDAMEFGVARDPAFYRWRYGTYPLARPTFLAEAGRWRATLLQVADRASISDHSCVDAEAFATMWASVARCLAETPVRSVRVETNQPEMSRWLGQLGSRVHIFQNRYHFDVDRLLSAGVDVEVLDRWEHARLNECEASGDVLLR